MKTFKSYHNQDLEEKLLRPAAVLALAAKSRASGNKAEIFYRRGLDATKQIHRGMPEQEIPILIAAVLRNLILGNIYRRKQQGDAVGIDVIGHLSTKKKR
tara:strand:+ start:207 stop:506 length:300 start_codon:yes stop_codon:yes gene_type:complete